MKQVMRLYFLLIIVFLAVPQFVFGQIEREHWDRADSLTVRLSPAEFDDLPINIVQYLLEKGYTIPQSWYYSEPHNVISGSFQKKGQSDWAVLASNERESKILVFWNGSEKNPAEISKLPDRNFLSAIGRDQIGFARAINPIGKGRIMQYFEAYGGTKPPLIEHKGINDAFIEKGSVIHYFYNGEWLSLTGAD